VPRLATYSFQVWRGREGKNSNILLPLVASTPGAPIFEADQAHPQRDRGRGPLETATPGPLTLTAYVIPEGSNPGGWLAWAPHILFECSGGSGPVTCPEEQIILNDGVNQSFTYEAHDEAGNTATVTVSSLNIDRTPPQLAAALPERQTF